jgi:hypothetical protein
MGLWFYRCNLHFFSIGAVVKNGRKGFKVENILEGGFIIDNSNEIKN